MKRSLSIIIATVVLLATPTAFASYHTFQIEQLYSNADGSVQFIVMHESVGANGESFWTGNQLSSMHAGVTKTFAFPNDLPGGGSDYYGGMTLSPTAHKRVLIATQAFAALHVVSPDFIIPSGFLATDGGTVNYAGVDSVTYTALPVDGTNAIDRFGNTIPNAATDFAGVSGSVVAAAPPAAPVEISPVPGIWANPNESGTGYGLAFNHGVLVVAIYAYQAGGAAQWYLASGPVLNNVFTATLDKYVGGQCISCNYMGPPTLVGNDGTMTITFTSATSATLNLPGGRVTQIAPFVF